MTTSHPPLNEKPANPPPSDSAAKKPTRRVVLGGALAMVLSAGGAAAWALDRFVVEHVEISDVSAYEASQSATAATTSTGTTESTAATVPTVLTDTGFSSGDANIAISTATTGSGSNLATYFVADVQLAAGTALRSAFAQDSFGENITENTSAIAADNGAVFAINGDYYGFRDTGIVVRNGVAYRDKGAREGLAFYRDGTATMYDETTTSAAELVADGVWNTLSFGPSLIEGGAVKAGIDSVEVDTNIGNHSIQGLQPRTAVGVLGTNHLVFVVVDGRSEGYSAGATMSGLAQIMLDLGATTAYNVDGGGSSTMYFNGALVNNPLGKNQERGTSDILYVAG